VRARVLAILAAGAFIAADVPDDDLKRLQGTWRVVSDVFEGLPQPVRDARIVISGDRWDQSQTFLRSGTYELDTARRPATIRWRYDEPTPVRLVDGIYSLSGDTFKHCFDFRTRTAPTDFAPRPGQVLETWQRNGDAGGGAGGLEGEWKLVGREANGGPMGDEDVKGTTLRFRGGRFENRRDYTARWTIKLDQASDPKRIDLTHVSGGGGFMKGRTSLGIYRLEGDTLTLCKAVLGHPRRPTLFESSPAQWSSLLVLKRVTR
jgi:uncharacterized protein (TIGR03067 family)